MEPMMSRRQGSSIGQETRVGSIPFPGFAHANLIPRLQHYHQRLRCKGSAAGTRFIPSTRSLPYHAHLPNNSAPVRSSPEAVACRALPLGYIPTSGHPNWDLICALSAAVAAYAWVKIFDKLATAGVIDQKLSRKLVHSTAGPLFVLLWPLFSDAPNARFWAAAVPCLNLVRVELKQATAIRPGNLAAVMTVYIELLWGQWFWLPAINLTAFWRLLIVGSGIVRDPGLVHSVSRGGDKAELLKGPLYYVLVMISMTVIFCRHHPAGLMAISMMCGGDGMADIVGRRLGGSKLPWNSNKSWAGSAAMFFGGMAMAGGFVWLYCSLGYFDCLSVQYMLPYIAVVCFSSTFVEALPINQWVDDNLSVPVLAVAVSCLLLPYVTAASQGCPVDAHTLVKQALKL